MITVKDIIEYASAGLVFVSGALAGHYAADGMSLVQWAGAAAAVLGSVSLAVAVRVWPQPVKAGRQSD
jgi:hypothetical protein